MQDKYISLDPQHADSTSAGVRKSLWIQRITEAQGGEAAALIGAQSGATFGLLTWAKFRAGGYRMMPFGPAKAPKVCAIAAMTGFGWWYGFNFVSIKSGDNDYYQYLVANRGKILSGEKNMN